MTREELADSRGINRTVYQPAEDSRLLFEAVKKAGYGQLLEVGTGSGWVARRAALVTDVDAVYASDINPHACQVTRAQSEVDIGVVQANLTSCFFEGVFDTVAFNPPYLPTDESAEWDDWMEQALSGGETGRKVIMPFLNVVGRVLNSEGIVLLVVSSLTNYEKVMNYAETRGFDYTKLIEESYPFETLTVVQLNNNL